MFYPNLTKPEAESLRELRRRIGANIQRARMTRRLRLEVCASASGLLLTKLDRYEMGGGDITLSELVKLSYVLQVPATELLV